MAEEEATTTTPADEAASALEIEKKAFLDRLEKESAKRKETEKQLAALRKEMDDRDSQGLPELDRLKKDLESAKKRAEDAEKLAQDNERQALNLRKEGWVTAAARDLGFIDPEDALNPRHVDLAAVESREDAERILKRVAKAKKHLVKAEEPERPQIGQVLANGKAADGKPAAVSADLNDPDFRRQLGEDMLAVLKGGKQ